MVIEEIIYTCCEVSPDMQLPCYLWPLHIPFPHPRGHEFQMRIQVSQDWAKLWIQIPIPYPV